MSVRERTFADVGIAIPAGRSGEIDVLCPECSHTRKKSRQKCLSVNTEAIPRSYSEAKAVGAKHYFTGKPCPNGHIARRFTSNSGCEECLKAGFRKRYAENPEPMREKNRQYAKRFPEKNRAKSARWLASLPEETRKALQAKWRKNNSAQRIAYNAKWVARHPHRARAIRKNVRARRRGAVGDGRVTAQEWEQIKEQHGNRCLCCGVSGEMVTLTQDHVVPLSKGGRHVAENIQPLCGPCNTRKFTKTIDYRVSAS